MSSFCQVLRQRSAALLEAQRGAQSAQTERATVEERLRGLQRAVAMLETEKKDAERQAVRLEKDKNALRNTLDKVCTVFKKIHEPFGHILISVISFFLFQFCSSSTGLQTAVDVLLYIKFKFHSSTSDIDPVL